MNMNTILQLLSQYVSKAFEMLGYKGLGVVSVSDRADLCHYQSNDAFRAAKISKQPPLTIANELADILKKYSIFERVEVARPGFVNLVLKDEFLMRYALNIYDDKNNGIPLNDSPETIVVDYGGPNIAKPLHIGHLRSAIIGEALKRLFKSVGHNVISDVHLGDWGLQIGLVIAEYQERYPEWFDINESDRVNRDELVRIEMNELNDIYPHASQKSKTNEKFRNTAKKITSELQKGDVRYLALWEKIRQASVEDLEKIYRTLSVDFDYWYGESDAQEFVEELMVRLEHKGLLRESEGAMIVDVSEESDKCNIPPIIVKSSDSSSLYATTDLATIIQRMRDFAPARICYVADSRQELHFNQVFRCSKLANIVTSNVNLEFLGFGTINGSDDKPFKTRDGGTMKLEEFIKMVKVATDKQLESSTYCQSMLNDEKDTLSMKIAVAAIKFGDLINHRSKNYIFDFNRFLAFEGKTGPYVLYTISRINSLLSKSACNEVEFSVVDTLSTVERELLLNIVQIGDIFLSAVNNRAPNIICEYAYDLAASFSKLYHAVNIIKEPDYNKKSNLLNLVIITRKILMRCLDVLGIEAVEYM